MSDLFLKKDLTDEDYILKFSILYLGLKTKAKDETKIRNEANVAAIKDFRSNSSKDFLYAVQQGADGIQLTMDYTKVDLLKQKKAIMCVKTDQTVVDPKDAKQDSSRLCDRVVFMEISKPILESMHNVCNDVFLPVLGNPQNQIGWSDLVTKDLMEKFHSFLAYTYVTIGQCKGRCLLPLPPHEVTASEKTLSKEKSQVLETAIIHWSKQIKNVLRQDPENSLKDGKHPGPIAEIDFWTKQAENLNSICEQLNTERIKKVLKFLEQNKSTYTAPFSKLQKEVQKAREEANENNKYLSTLRKLFDEMGACSDLSDFSELFVPVIHTIMLIYKHSPHYNTTPRLVVLIRMICNEIIKQCCSNVSGREIFEELKEGVGVDSAEKKLRSAFECCAAFKLAYFDYKQNKVDGQWKFQNQALFVRLDEFSGRCQDLMQMTETIRQFNKLEKIDIGNTKGAVMSQAIKQIFDEFKKAQANFCSVSYDVMNIEEKNFDNDFFTFRTSIKELERRLAALLAQSFEDCDSIVGKSKLLDSFEGLLTRPSVCDELERKQLVLLEMVKSDLKQVQQLFLEGRELIAANAGNSPIAQNMPPIAGALSWTNGLRSRILESTACLVKFESSMENREEFKEVKKLTDSIQNTFNQFEAENIKSWEQGVEEFTEEKLDKFLLVREETEVAIEGFMRVNFADELRAILREVKYLQLLDAQVHPTALKLFTKVEIYRVDTIRLQFLVDTYNNILKTLLPVEKPLLQKKINACVTALQQGTDTLKWNSDSSKIDKFIKAAKEIICEVDDLVKKMKENVNRMQNTLQLWKEPLFERQGNKPMAPDVLIGNHAAMVENRFEQVVVQGKEIHKYLKDTFDAVRSDKKSKEWMSYVDYVNGLLIEGIVAGIHASCTYLLSCLDSKGGNLNTPIFEMKVVMNGRTVEFEPSIECNARGNGIRNIIEQIMGDFISLAVKTQRLDSTTGGNPQATGDYLVEIRDSFDLFGAIQSVAHRLDEIEQSSKDFLNQYAEFEFLYREDLESEFNKFLDTGRDISEEFEERLEKRIQEEDLEEVEIAVARENFEAMKKKIFNGVSTRYPPLAQFDEKIQHFIEIKQHIKAMEPIGYVGWLKIDSSPVKNHLTCEIQRWIEKFTHFLLLNFKNKLQNIIEWTGEVQQGIQTLPRADMENLTKQALAKEKQVLTTVMTHLRDMKQIKGDTDSQFGPMKEMVQLLKKHSDHFEWKKEIEGDEKERKEVDYLIKIDQAKTKLNETNDKAMREVKEKILPLQKTEGENVKRDKDLFRERVIGFKVEFGDSVPKNVKDPSPQAINEAYAKIGLYYNRLKEFERQRDELANKETLFDLDRSIYKELKECNNDLINLKKMWDLIALVDMQFENWKKTRWDKINVDDLQTLLKEIATKQCNQQSPQNKEFKGWYAFKSLNDRVKNMGTVLPLVALLHSEFMLDRHWESLAQNIVKKHIKTPKSDPTFCLNDLIVLKLHEFSDDVNELVDGAAKEDKISKKLDNIERIWETLSFNFESREDGIPLLIQLDQVTENLDQHLLDLMGMMSSKDVEFFRTKVETWTKTLKTVEAVIDKWVKVQKDYLKLQPIFLQSEDIRTSLPDETKKFEVIDQNFRAIMQEAQDDPKVTLCAGSVEQLNKLKELQAEIDFCEKALNDYLEAKKKSFPRFYFVSNQALLEILSNGNNPRRVDDFLADCFDGMKSMNLKPQDPADKTPMQGQGMISKENEEVKFGEGKNFICVGPVEVYLSNLEKKMQDTLGEILVEAKDSIDGWVEANEIQQRHFWLNDYCAQLALLVTQIVWTEETSRAFEDLESGSESAMKDNLDVIKVRISKLIGRVRQQLDVQTRVKIITIITIDVHSRDVVQRFVDEKISSQEHFAWQSQLKFALDDGQKGKKEAYKKCKAMIADWTTWYNYEYVGNTGRLVITPLTDRCYITLTQALNLSMGGAPAGPAGTGKTETTKDLGRALGLQVVVFNCSPQMTYLSMAQIFMGLSQAGAWGCFDEFNRIDISVLSVVSTQVKYCLDHIKVMKADPSKIMFKFGDEEEIPMRITSGFFITMNPGYAGRTELPENLKALFRSCAMVVPDIILICENMLMSEGFQDAKILSTKFMELYTLCASLLSKQRHYDWGLRAVKSVLRQAGQLKRASPDDPELLILMRALRDFNTPKIVIDDIPIFMGLIKDLFPGLDPEVIVDPKVKEACEHCARDPDYLPLKQLPGGGKMDIKIQEKYIEKCVELYDLLTVRHSVFIIGFPGSAKSSVWQLLARGCTHMGRITAFEIVDPKCVSTNELFGYMNPKTKEWRDGVLSTMMRDMSKCQGKFTQAQQYKWVVLDGDVDPMWIESCNTVMDDNKMLTLVSQERIPLSPAMRLILEVSHLKYATPATVSRGGVLFINENDIGWKPHWDSWVEKFKREKNMISEVAYNTFMLNLATYLDDGFIDDCKRKPTIAPMCTMAYVQSLICILDFCYEEFKTEKIYTDFVKKIRDQEAETMSRLGPNAADFDTCLKQIFEGMFVFALTWSFGAAFTDDKIWFSGMMRNKCKVKIPEAGLIYDYRFDILSISWIMWSDGLAKMDPNFEGLYSNLIVPTVETRRQSRLIEIHTPQKRGLFYGGIAGTGKTTILKNFIQNMSREKYTSATVNFNSYTDSQAFQVVLESNCVKRYGKIFGPEIGRKLLFFVDDINMPTVDEYGTQQPIAMMRQIIDYELVFDRNALSEQKYLVDIMFAACMNPKSGSFFVDLRLQRHFTTVALQLLEAEGLKSLYGQILDNHFQNFDKNSQDLITRIVSATAIMFQKITSDKKLYPTATKFHYQFNLRDFATIAQTFLLCNPTVFKNNPLSLVRLWLHECNRVWLDRLIRKEDVDLYNSFVSTAMKEFPSLKPEDVTSDKPEAPLIFTSFISQCRGHEATLMAVTNLEELNKVLEEKLEEYSEQVVKMDLVLFTQAMEHVTRIARIIDQPKGHALLVGVGGSGKQSLSRLAQFILNYQLFKIVVTGSFNIEMLRIEEQNVFKKAGVSGEQQLFILTDTQIIDEKFLISINDILSSGYVPELFNDEEKDEIRGKVRSEAKSLGIPDMPDDQWNFFLDKVTKNLHICLCFSPVSEKFRIRARKFPALINSTKIDWFHEWPEDALIGVANRFLATIDLPSDELRDSIAKNMANVHLSIGAANIEFKQKERRFNYTTPTSYLELISFYKLLLGKKQGNLDVLINRLENGLGIMINTLQQVDELKKFLDAKMINVAYEKKKTQELIEVVERETEIANEEEEKATQQAETVGKIKGEADAQAAEVAKQLEEAIPAMEAARKAVDGLSTKSIGEFKGMANPPTGCDKVTQAVMILRNEKGKHEWPQAQNMMKDPNKFKQQLEEYNKEGITDDHMKKLEPILSLEFFNEEAMKKKSSAATNLCVWVLAVVKYNQIWRKVRPLQEKAEAAAATAKEKGDELDIVMGNLAKVKAKVKGLNDQLDEAKAALKKVEDEANQLMIKLNLAERLVNGLADERVRWAENVVTYKVEKTTMIGNALVSAAFVSYIGPFLYSFRDRLWREEWLPDMLSKKIPFTEGVDPLFVLSTKSEQATWAQQELPADRVSLENAAIVVSCSRFPLIIDPQLQGIRWIKGREQTQGMEIIQLSEDKWMRKVEGALENGKVLMIEALGQDIDATLDPLLSRQFVTRGNKQYVKLGEEKEIARGFKLYLQTKLMNPHYKPETAAQCTIINFLVTEKGLEDQLLASVVRVERPELELEKEKLTSEQNEFKIVLEGLESDLLTKLGEADQETILTNIALIEQLEKTKETSTEIKRKQEQAVISEERINKLREVYRIVATEGAMLYFLLIQLCVVEMMYQYSLKAFETFFFKAIEQTPHCDDEIERGLKLRQKIREVIYQWVSRGLFERHKQILQGLIVFRLMAKKIVSVDYTQTQLDFLINCPQKIDPSNPNTQKKWLSDSAWGSVLKLQEIEGYEQIGAQISKEASKRFEEWYNEDRPEEQPLPGEYRAWENDNFFKKMLIIRTLRPDRMTTALTIFFNKTLENGKAFTECDAGLNSVQILSEAYNDSNPTIPIYFILSPGANPIKDIEALATMKNINTKTSFHMVALGQGQDTNAFNKLELGHKEGHWVVLQNIHLMPEFMRILDEKLNQYAQMGSHANFRLFLTSDPGHELMPIPIGLLEKCIKLTNEPPAGMKANLQRAFAFFDPHYFEGLEAKNKTILFALSFFHAVMVERRKFGPKGWNAHYNFSIGDLRDSEIVCKNYLEKSASTSGKIPWDDLRYIFGDIMYGGYITDDFDRLLCSTYLINMMNEELFGEPELFPFCDGRGGITFKCPHAQSHEQYSEYIKNELPPETPLAFGMHPNAEIDFRTTQCAALFKQLVELSPKDSSSGESDAPTPMSKFIDFEEKVQEYSLADNKPNIDDIRSKIGDDPTNEMLPYQNVFLQECEVIGILISAVCKSLGDIVLANKGELTMSDQMEALMYDIYLNRVPASWMNLSFESTRGLLSWLDSLKARLEQLNAWKDDPSRLPQPVTWLNRLKNPNSFLTAIKQVHARRTQIELNRLYIQTDILKKWYWDAELPKTEGALVFGMQIEGAKWDFSGGSLEESEPKKQFSLLPVVNCKAGDKDKLQKGDKTIFNCPIYLTPLRGKSYVGVTAQLKTKINPNKWILAGVSIILDVEGFSDPYKPGFTPAP